MSWWITTGQLKQGGQKVLGPFESRDLALDVRTYVEAMPQSKRRGAASQQSTFWVDEDVTVDA